MDIKKRLYQELPFEFNYTRFTEEELMVLTIIHKNVGKEPISDDELLSKIILDENIGDFDLMDLFLIVQEYCVISECKFIYQENSYTLSL